MRDESNSSKGYAFINFASFEAADGALEAMNGQYLCNRPITISYAFKKDSKGERHGTEAERFLAAQNPLPQADRPHQLFADAPPTQSSQHQQQQQNNMMPHHHHHHPMQPPMMGMPPG
jgi:splicing factor 3B subunit 4